MLLDSDQAIWVGGLKLAYRCPDCKSELIALCEKCHGKGWVSSRDGDNLLEFLKLFGDEQVEISGLEQTISAEEIVINQYSGRIDIYNKEVKPKIKTWENCEWSDLHKQWIITDEIPF